MGVRFPLPAPSIAYSFSVVCEERHSFFGHPGYKIGYSAHSCIFNRLRISGTYSSPAIYFSVVYARLRSAQRNRSASRHSAIKDEAELIDWGREPQSAFRPSSERHPNLGIEKWLAANHCCRLPVAPRCSTQTLYEKTSASRSFGVTSQKLRVRVRELFTERV
jgi:hypothetical protein